MELYRERKNKKKIVWWCSGGASVLDGGLGKPSNFYVDFIVISLRDHLQFHHAFYYLFLFTPSLHQLPLFFTYSSF